jgi:hypothetical protein
MMILSVLGLCTSFGGGWLASHEMTRSALPLVAAPAPGAAGGVGTPGGEVVLLPQWYNRIDIGRRALGSPLVVGWTSAIRVKNSPVVMLRTW